MSLTKVPKSMLLNSSGGGDINFITNSDGSDGVVGYVEGSYSAAALPAGTFTASSGASAFEVANTFAPLGIGTTSLTFTKYAGSSRQGRAVEYEFDLPVAYRAKVLTIKNQYIVNSGTFVAGTSSTNSSMIFYTSFYDGSSWTVAQPSSFKLLSNSTTVSDVFSSSVQSPSNATKMKLIAYVAETATTAWEVKANLSVSPSNYVYGTPITDWQSYTPTWTGTGGTPSKGDGTLTGRWRRVGQNAEIQIYLIFGTTTTANTATVWQFSYPTGLSINTSALADSSNSTQGSGVILDNGTQLLTTIPTALSSGIRHYTNAAANSIGYQIPMTWTNGDYLISTVSVPILGWSSSVQMSDQTDTRVIATKAALTTASQTGINPNNSAVKIILQGSLIDTHGAFSVSNSRIDIKVPGNYSIAANIQLTGTNILANTYALYLYVNGVFRSQGTATTASVGSSLTMIHSDLQYLNINDYVELYLYGQGNNSVSTLTASFNNLGAINYLAVSRISGPSAIAASESVNARYTSTAGQSIANSGVQIIDFGTKDYDSHGSVTTGASWKFTAQISGKYRISAFVSYNALLYAVGNNADIYIYKNGAAYSIGPTWDAQSAATVQASNSIGDTVQMAAGDYIDIRVSNLRTAGASALTTGAGSVSISVERVGN